MDNFIVVYLRNKYLLRLINSLAMIKNEFLNHFLLIIGLIKVKLFFKKEEINKLEIGVGNSGKKDGFITLDLNIKADYPYDLRNGLPFQDYSIDFIYSEHVLEHFNYNDLINLLRECYRVLKTNGVFSAVVPNARLYLEAYFNPKGFDLEKSCTYDFGLSYKSKIDYVNYIFYMDGHHHYMFDEENILSILEDIGFKNVKLRNFLRGLDQEARRYGSIYVDGIKSMD